MEKKIKVKICGITNLVDRDAVVAAGADYFGVIIEVPWSPRSLELPQAAVICNIRAINRVAVLVEPSKDFCLKVIERLHPTAVQLHGNESPEFVAEIKGQADTELWKALHIPAEITDREKLKDELQEQITTYAQAGVNAILLDTKIKTKNGGRSGGTGTAFDWDVIKEVALPPEVSLFIAGGISPENVTELLKMQSFSGIDVNSGVELYPGKKDPVKIRLLMECVRNSLMYDAKPGD